MRIARRREDHANVERLLGSVTLAGKPLYWTSCYRIPGQNGDVLVDSLSPRLASLLARAWPRPPGTVLLTHHHEDHAGGAPTLAASGARVVAPAASLDLLAAGERVPAYRALIWGSRTGVAAEPAPEIVETSAGRFRAIPSPGHSEDHVAWFAQDAGWLFTGDAYFPRRRAARYDEDMQAVARGLRTLASLGPERAFPAHGAAIEKPREAFEAAADALDDLGRKARRLRESGRSWRAVRRNLLGPEGAMFYASGGEFSAENLVRSLGS